MISKVKEYIICFLNTLSLIFRVIIRLNVKNNFNLLKNKLLKENITFNSCIVLGNGPSLNDSLKDCLEFIMSKTKICCNSFVLSEWFLILKPEYYFFVDPGWWQDDTLCSNALVELRKKVFQKIEKNTTWNMIIFTYREAKYSAFFNTISSTNRNIRICYLSNISTLYCIKKISHFFYKKNLAMISPQTVLIAQLFAAINLGFKKIYLFGGDHSWLLNYYVSFDNKVYIKDTHFYEGEKIKLMPCLKNAITGDTYKMHEQMHSLKKAFYGHILIDDYAKYSKCKIYNCTPNSFIDAYERYNVNSQPLQRNN